jgi:class 3 adenylate cyclase
MKRLLRTNDSLIMAVYINHKNPTSRNLEKILNKIPPCPGTCIFIDLVESTGIKYKKGIGHWGKLINNTFNFISLLNDFPENIVKGIGDELMIYIPDEILAKKETFSNHYSIIEELYATLHNIESYPVKNLFMNCKVSLHYCTDVYNITFLKGYNDYYGKDIDLTARLMSKSGKNRIVFSEAFYIKVKDDLQKFNIPEEITCLNQVSGIFSDNFKGIPFPVSYRTIDV